MIALPPRRHRRRLSDEPYSIQRCALAVIIPHGPPTQWPFPLLVAPLAVLPASPALPQRTHQHRVSFIRRAGLFRVVHGPENDWCAAPGFAGQLVTQTAGHGTRRPGYVNGGRRLHIIDFESQRMSIFERLFTLNVVTHSASPMVGPSTGSSSELNRYINKISTTKNTFFCSSAVAHGSSIVISATGTRCSGSRFGRSQIRLNAYPACARKRSPAFVCSGVVAKTYLTPRPSFLKRLSYPACIFIKNLRILIIIEYLMYY